MKDGIILSKLAQLIADGNFLGENLQSCLDAESYSSYNIRNFSYYQKAKKWKTSVSNLLKVRFGANSDYYQEFIQTVNRQNPNSGEFFKENIQMANGALEAIQDAMLSGLTDDLFYKKEIIVFTDLLEQANEFLEKDFKLAAGIYGRVVLESTIKEFASKNGISDENKFDQLIIKLRSGEFIQKPFENSLRANYEIGSWAAHGDEKFAQLNKSQIKEFLDFIRDKVLTLQ